MFNKFYKFYKYSLNTPFNKQQTRLFIGKDLRYNRVDYYNIMSHLVGKNWILENKLMDVEVLILKKVFRFIFLVVFLYVTTIIIIY